MDRRLGHGSSVLRRQVPRRRPVPPDRLRIGPAGSAAVRQVPEPPGSDGNTLDGRTRVNNQ
ncbi:hypothetical protein BF93_08485 [Brachybacterium phenoliresistens]|uniref:Uncharacterized protein n=1 Tax=Brachybacterium phenoliresistens TaxID=396014 RepID=Z9JNG6_9MICO|nr:hypothetical protein BF93_08485 [Brachybacterium phenoliresistens]